MTSIQKLPIAVDATISRSIREVRTAAGLSMMALADELGISYQQIQKLRKGGLQNCSVAAASDSHCLRRAYRDDVRVVAENEGSDHLSAVGLEPSD